MIRTASGLHGADPEAPELRMEDNNEVFDESHRNGIAELHDKTSHPERRRAADAEA